MFGTQDLADDRSWRILLQKSDYECEALMRHLRDAGWRVLEAVSAELTCPAPVSHHAAHTAHVARNGRELHSGRAEVDELGP